MRLSAGEKSQLTLEKMAEWNDDQLDAEMIIAEEFARMKNNQPTHRGDFGFDTIDSGVGGGAETEGVGENPLLIDWENRPIEEAQEYVRAMFAELTK